MSSAFFCGGSISCPVPGYGVWKLMEICSMAGFFFAYSIASSRDSQLRVFNTILTLRCLWPLLAIFSSNFAKLPSPLTASWYLPMPSIDTHIECGCIQEKSC